MAALSEKISEFTIRRLSTYYRILMDLGQKSIATVSSASLADLCGVTSAQVRKDLSYFGNFGTRGLGYQVDELKDAIGAILGLDRKWTMVLFGAGSLGHALFFHQGFKDDGFYFTHIFNVEPTKVGIRWESMEIRPVGEARNILGADPVDIGVIATPAKSAQEVADILVENEVKGILNFAPKRISVPENVRLRNVNLAVALENLTFFLSS
ncbi:MAG: redox-sensing transcriptional repressor Rex [Candidatus Krumholzibacteria bacterium]|nr:redox-sensing transcriptional repressor Rex [Candidatus Krumholzibacteria bacterium]